MVDEIMETAARMNLNVIRTWGFCDGIKKDGYVFQPSPRVYNENTFKKMDYIIYKASQYNIKLIIPFVNNWDDMGGMNQYVRWAKGSNHDDFYADPWIRQVYKDYVKHFLTRVNSITGVAYKDDPTILMWELANEPRRQTNNGVEFQWWVDEMGLFIKSIDPNHLLAIGDEGFLANKPDGDWMHNGSQGINFIANNQSKYIDVASFHMYPDPWGLNEKQAKEWIEEHIDIAKNILNKPVFMGEFGIADKGKRDRVYSEWYDLAIARGLPGIVFWLLSGHQDDGSLYPDYDGFTVYTHENTSVVIRNASMRFLDRSLDNLD
jgi:mannan endo-1,4-beta-mannosidase